MATEHKPNRKPRTEEMPDSDETEDPHALPFARLVIQPTVQAAAAIADYDKAYGNIDLMALIDALEEQTTTIDDGDLGRAEAMLTAQAHTLDAIFNNLARRAINAGYVDKLDRLLKLAPQVVDLGEQVLHPGHEGARVGAAIPLPDPQLQQLLANPQGGVVLPGGEAGLHLVKQPVVEDRPLRVPAAQVR